MTTEAPPRPASPANRLDLIDPGDETQRNFRYQHAYGVILLVSASTNLRDYVAIWCEHHEDFLAERLSGTFHAYQIKTRQPEDGPWKLNDGPLRDSLKRFVRLNALFPGAIDAFYFVSNSNVFDSKSERELTKCPLRLRDAVRATNSPPADPWSAVFQSLCEHCECDPAAMVEVLAKLDFIVGPGRDSFDAEVAHQHIPTIPHCANLNASDLSGLRDELIQKVFSASSLVVNSPEKHLCPIDASDRTNPALLAKRVPVSVVEEITRRPVVTPFRMLPQRRHLALKGEARKLGVLGQKFIAAGLAEHLETMQDRTMSAERHLLTMAYGRDDIEAVLDQLEGIVKGECDDAGLKASLEGEPYGPRMLAQVQDRLRRIAQDDPALVEFQSYQCLIGIAGLLTEACRVWWSEPFAIEDGSGA